NLARDLQLSLRLSRVEIVLWIENRKVLADDFVGGVALESFGAGIPADDVPQRVEHENPVVFDRLHDEAKTLFALLERFVGQATCREIANDDGKPHERPDRIAKRGERDLRAERRAIFARKPYVIVSATVANRRREERFWFSARSILRRKEAREQPASSLVG